MYHLKSDGGTEFKNRKLQSILESIGCDYSYSAPYTPQHNGRSERLNRTLLSLARTLIQDSSLNKGIWGEAVNFAAHLLNCLKFNKLRNKTPFEIITGHKPYLGRVLRFGTRCYFYDRTPNKDKLDRRAIPGAVVGIDEDGLSYRVLELGTTRIHRIRDLVVRNPTVLYDHENQLPPEPTNKSQLNDSSKGATNAEGEEEPSPPSEAEQSSDAAEQYSNEAEQSIAGSSGLDGERNVDADLGLLPGDDPSESKLTGEPSPRRKKAPAGRRDIEPASHSHRLRDRSKLKRPDYFIAGLAQPAPTNSMHNNPNFNVGSEEDEPITYKDVKNSRYRKQWETAMQEEMDSIRQHAVWVLVKPPRGRKILGCRWIFSRKRGPDGRVLRYKARIVLKGYAQRPGIDFKDLYSPVARFETIKCILALSAKEHLTVYQFDVKTAFLSADIDTELFMHQPEGFDDGTGRVCALKKALYGTKQAPRAFNQKINNTLLGMKLVSLVQSQADPCVYFSKPPHRLIVAIYVDDGIVTASDEKLVRDFIAELGKTFELTSRPIEYFLGLHVLVSPDKSRIHIHQAKYIDELLHRFGMSECKPSAIPIDVASKDAAEGEVDLSLPYREVVGGLMYACIATRADCSYAVSFLSRYLDKPTRQLWNVAMKVLRYLKATRTHGLSYTDSGTNEVEAFSDADFAGCTASRRSTSGCFIRFGGGAISWSSRRQPIVTLSSLESELVAATDTAKECIWVVRLLKEAGYDVKPKLLVDNTAAIRLVEVTKYFKRCKHIHTRYFFVREKVQSGEFSIQHCPTEENLADILTKVLAKPRFQKLRTLLGIVNGPDITSPPSGVSGN